MDRAYLLLITFCMIQNKLVYLSQYSGLPKNQGSEYFAIHWKCKNCANNKEKNTQFFYKISYDRKCQFLHSFGKIRPIDVICKAVLWIWILCLEVKSRSGSRCWSWIRIQILILDNTMGSLKIEHEDRFIRLNWQRHWLSQIKQ